MSKPNGGRDPRVKSLVTRSRSEVREDPISSHCVMVTRGSTIIRAETAVGEVLADVLEPLREPHKTIRLEIPNRPTLAGLVIKPGEKVLEGQQAQLERVS